MSARVSPPTKLWMWVYLWLPAVVAAGLVAYATRLGPAVNSDSVEFIVAAKTFANGGGLGLPTASGGFMPLRLHPPLLPLVLAAAEWIGVDAVAAARGLNIGLFAISALLVGYVFFQATGLRTPSMMIGLLFASSTPLINVSASALSEPLFLALGIAAMALLAIPSGSGPRWRPYAAAFLVGLSVLTRFPGVALAGALALFVGSFRTGAFRWRIGDSLTFLVIALWPVALWIAYLRFGQGGAFPRSLSLNLEGLWSALTPFRIALVDQTWRWFQLEGLLPEVAYRPRLWILGTGGAVGLVAVAISWARRDDRVRWWRDPSVRLLSLLLMSAGAFAVFMAIAFGLGRPSPDLDERTFGPYLLALSGGSLVALNSLFVPLLDRRMRTFLLTVLTASFILIQTPPMLQAVETQHKDGRGYTDARWRSSGVIDGLKRLSSTTPLISNDSAAILFLAGRPAYDIPELQTGERAPDLSAPFGSGSRRAERAFREEGGVLVLFDKVLFQLEAVYGENASRRLAGLTDGLEVLADYWDGTIYRFPTRPRD